MSRDELLVTNAKIVQTVVRELVAAFAEHHSHHRDEPA